MLCDSSSGLLCAGTLRFPDNLHGINEAFQKVVFGLAGIISPILFCEFLAQQFEFFLRLQTLFTRPFLMLLKLTQIRSAGFQLFYGEILNQMTVVWFVVFWQQISSSLLLQRSFQILN